MLLLLSAYQCFCADGRWAPVQSKAVLALAGLLSAAISIHKTWNK